MKYICFLFLLYATTSGIYAQGDPFKLPDIDFCSSFDKPLTLLKGQSIAFTVPCDTLYIINKGRFNMYDKLHSWILSGKSDSLSNVLLNIHLSMMDSTAVFFKKLNDSNKDLERLAKDMNKYTTTTLTQAQISLNSTMESLDKASKDIAEVKENLDKARKEIRCDRWKAGIIGGGAGFVLATTLFLIFN